MYRVMGGEKLKSILRICIKENKKVFISGSPGIGKSEITMQVVNELKKEFIEERLYLKEPGEAKGLPDIVNIDGEPTTIWSRPSWLPKKNNSVLFLDDIHLANEIQQSPLFEILLKGSLNNYKVPKDLTIIAAGNLELKGAGSNEILAPIMNRFDLVIEFHPELDDFIEYAVKNENFDSRLVSFLITNKEFLYSIDPPVSRPFNSPRSWISLNKNIKIGLPIESAIGTIGFEAGSKLIDSWNILNLSKNEILERFNDNKIDLKDQVILGSILARFDPDNELLDIVSNFHPDVIFVYIKSLSVHNIKLLYKLAKNKHPIFTKVIKYLDEIFKDEKNEY